MRRLRGELEAAIRRILKEKWHLRLPQGELAEISCVDFPRRAELGDFASSAALKLARRLKRPARDVAKDLARSLREDAPEAVEVFSGIEVAGPGFLNFTLKEEALLESLEEILHLKEEYGKSSLGKGDRVQVEFVSANPTGPLTVAHGRQAAVGDVLANLLEEAGFRPTREYYVNDSGNQIRLLGKSIYARYLELEGREYPFPEDGYQGQYIREIAAGIRRDNDGRFLSMGEEEAVEALGELGSAVILEAIKKDLSDFRVRFDLYFSQKALETSQEVERLIASLRHKGLLYEKDGAVWMRTSDFGDSEDRVLVKSDGSYTYRATDIAYHLNKFARGFSRVIDLWGPDHHGHIQTMASCLRALGYAEQSLTMMIVQFCTLWEGKKKLKMSTRAGQFITLREVFEAVGVDAARYFFVSRKTDSHLDFDLELAKKRSMENPVYYVQYAHARASSVFEKALEKAEANPDFAPLKEEIRDGLYIPQEVDLALLSEIDIELVRLLIRYPDVVERAAVALDPSRIPAYLEELAACFHNYYTRQRIITDSLEETKARLYLLSGVKIVLGKALALLGVSAPEKM